MRHVLPARVRHLARPPEQKLLRAAPSFHPLCPHVSPRAAGRGSHTGRTLTSGDAVNGGQASLSRMQLRNYLRRYVWPTGGRMPCGFRRRRTRGANVRSTRVQDLDTKQDSFGTCRGFPVLAVRGEKQNTPHRQRRGTDHRGYCRRATAACFETC